MSQDQLVVDGAHAYLRLWNSPLRSRVAPRIAPVRAPGPIPGRCSGAVTAFLF
jgi:hypothetical protein